MKKFFLMLAAMLTAVSPKVDAAVSLTLDQSIKMALSTSESIESAEAGREVAKWSLSSVRRSAGLKFSWTSEAYKIGGRDYESAKKSHEAYGDPKQVFTQTGVVGEDFPVYGYETVGSYAYNNTFSNRLSLTYPLYTGGSLEGQINAGEYQLNAADMSVENSRQTVRYQASEAYWNLVHQENMVEVAEEAVKRTDSQLELIKDQYDEGMVAKADVLMMEVRLANDKQNLVTAKGNFKVAQATLASMIGMPQDSEILPADELPYEPYPFTLDECENFAVTHRPDFVAAEYAVKRGEAQISAAKSGYRPNVTAIVSKSIVGNGAFQQERSSSWNAGVNLTWNIFDNAVTSANIATEKARVAQYQAEADSTEKNIRLETRSAYLRMKAAEENLIAASVTVKQAEENCMIAKIRYEEGVDILLNLTDAQERLTQTQTNYCNALYQYNLYRASLEKAIGIPVGMDVPSYVEAVSAGKSSPKAVAVSKISEENQEWEEPFTNR